MSFVRKWNLNELKGRYAKTSIVEPTIELHLGLKCADGRHEPVGCFFLDLNVQAANGFVTRRDVADSRVFDIGIYREPDGTYSLGVRRGATTPLAPYRRR
jgi:hypothetical protein